MSGGGLILDDGPGEPVLATRAADVRAHLPTKALSVGAWVSIDIPRRWGGIVGCVRDDGDLEKGWILGYDEQRFTFGLSTTGADDGDGSLTYLAAEQVPYEIGRWHHVVATYDGATCRLYVDGALAGSSTQQSGDIVYDLDVPFVMGAYLALLEKYAVDICFSGHVHDYERTFPIRDGRVTSYEDGGVVYVTTAGAGGHLENFDPNNTWFGHKKARYHHLVYVGVNGDHLEFQAIDQFGRLFDVFELRKSRDRRERINHRDRETRP